MTKIKDLISLFENFAPFSLQESYDNSGLITGNTDDEIKGVLITLDTTEEVVEEAIKKNCNVIVSHHPVIFKGLKKITGKNYVERTIIKAIKNDIAILAVHTNIDNVKVGVNGFLCDKLKLKDCKIMQSKSNLLKKLVTFVPVNDVDKVRSALFEAGAGKIGNYDSCSFNLSGEGTFRGNDSTNPYVGEKNKLHFENELRVETIYPDYLESKILSALFESHPYEEVAYDIYPLGNKFDQVGSGMLGYLEKEVEEIEFLKSLKEIFKLKFLKHTKLLERKIKKIAFCGGSGSFLLNNAISEKADIFISGDFKYHEFFDAENKILIADIGHFESEQYTKELFYELVSKKFSNFACFLAEVNTNPVKYF